MSTNDPIADAVSIRRAERPDLRSVLALLDAVDLPPDGVEAHLDDFVVASDAGGEIVGCAGAELHGATALLRSVAVLPTVRRSGLGSRLTEAALELARDRGARDAVLLTTTAADFFSRRHGFAPASRADFDDRLAASVEWRLPRCSSAAFLRRVL